MVYPWQRYPKDVYIIANVRISDYVFWPKFLSGRKKYLVLGNLLQTALSENKRKNSAMNRL